MSIIQPNEGGGEDKGVKVSKDGNLKSQVTSDFLKKYNSIIKGQSHLGKLFKKSIHSRIDFQHFMHNC